MKKLLTLALALMMALSCVAASATTVYTEIDIDSDVANSLMTTFGLSEDTIAMVEPIIALVSALGVKVTSVGADGQVDIDLNGTDAISVSYTTDDKGISVASTLFPNYLVTVSNETVGAIMEQFMANMPGGGEGGAGGMMDMAAMAEIFGGYYQKWFEACAAAGKPGEPVSGTFEFEGYTFDTMVPITVDIDAIADATRSLMDELLADPAAMAAIKGMAQGMAQSSGATFDDAKFEEEFKAGFEEWMGHFPKTVDVEFYTNSDGSEAFYMYGEAVREGEDGTFVVNMLFLDQTHMQMAYQDGDTMSAGFEMDGVDMNMYFDMSGMYFGLAMSFPENEYDFDVYFLTDQAPVLSVRVTTSVDGLLTMPATADGKTVLAVEDAMADQSGEAVQGLLGDVMVNGLGDLISVLSEAVPEAGALLGMFTGGGQMAS